MNEYDDLADLDDVFGPLRSAARPAELERESATVDLMVHAHRTVEGKHMFTSRRARIATLVAAGVLGFGGMAAASPNLSELLTTDQPADEPIEEPAVEEPVIEEPVIEEPVVEEPIVEEPAGEEPILGEVEIEEAVVEAVPEAEAPTDVVPLEDDPDPDTEFHEGYCEDGNHGKTVSAVARGVFDPDDEYPADLELSVKIAAQSSCGKTAEADDESDVDDEIESEVERADEPEVEKVEKPEPKAERPGKGDKGAEKASKGKSNGNGKGNAGGKPGR
jgi:hypothetical protein